MRVRTALRLLCVTLVGFCMCVFAVPPPKARTSRLVYMYFPSPAEQSPGDWPHHAGYEQAGGQAQRCGNLSWYEQAGGRDIPL